MRRRRGTRERRILDLGGSTRGRTLLFPRTRTMPPQTTPSRSEGAREAGARRLGERRASGGGDLKLPPTFAPSVLGPFPPLKFETDLEGKGSAAMAETRKALGQLNERSNWVLDRVAAMGSEVAGHFEPLVGEVVERLNTTVKLVHELQDAIGDVDDVSSLGGHSNLLDGLSDLFSSRVNVDQLKRVETSIKDVQSALVKLGDDLDDRITERLLESAGQIISRLKDLTVRVRATEDAIQEDRSLHGAGDQRELASRIGVTTVVEDQEGNDLFTVGDLLTKIQGLEDEVASLKSELADVRAQANSPGGVKFNDYSFESLDELYGIVEDEVPKFAPAAFTDPLSLFVHNPKSGVYKEVKDDAMDMDHLFKSGVVRKTDRRFVNSFYLTFPPLYHTESSATVGTTLTSLKTLETWNGRGSLPGKAKAITQALSLSRTNVKKYIRDHLKKGGTLATLAGEMEKAAAEFHTTLHTHMLNESTTLIELGIEEGEVCELLSEELILIFDRLFKCRTTVMEWDPNMDQVEYTTRVLWASLACLAKAEEFTRDGLAYHPIISAAFIRFLTKQTGENSAAGMAVKLKDLTRVLDNTVTDWDKKLKAVKQIAEGSQNKLEKLFRDNTSLKRQK